MTTIDLTKMNDREVAAYLSKYVHPNFEENITVSVWGCAKATLLYKNDCPDKGITGKQKYCGNCDECRYFAGCKIIKNNLDWGENVKGCCGLLLAGRNHDQQTAETR